MTTKYWVVDSPRYSEILASHLKWYDCPITVKIHRKECESVSPLEPLVFEDVELTDEGDGTFRLNLAPEQIGQLQEFFEKEKLWLAMQEHVEGRGHV